jgi:hypothetical protein
MFELLGGATSSSSSFSARGLLMMPYVKAWNASNLVYHFLLLIFVEALVHMGWCEYNTALGFKIPDSHAGEFFINCSTAYSVLHPSLLTGLCSNPSPSVRATQAPLPSRVPCPTGACPSPHGCGAGPSLYPSWMRRREATALTTRLTT